MRTLVSFCKIAGLGWFVFVTLPGGFDAILLLLGGDIARAGFSFLIAVAPIALIFTLVMVLEKFVRKGARADEAIADQGDDEERREEQQRREVEERKREAQEKKFRERASDIIHYLGSYPVYSDEILRVENKAWNTTTIEYLGGAAPRVVFQCEGEDAVWNLYKTAIDKPAWLDIQIYITGEWEARFEELAERARVEGERQWKDNKREEKKRKREELERERERFGL